MLGICCAAQNRSAALQLTSGSSPVSRWSRRPSAWEHAQMRHMLLTRSWLAPLSALCALLCFVHAVGLAQVCSDDGVCRGAAPARVASRRSSDLGFPPRNPTHLVVRPGGGVAR